jgi:hypothetical protein
MMLTMGILVRSHGPYMMPELKRMGIVWGYLTGMACSYYLLPLCYLHKHYLSTHKTIYNLVAQLALLEVTKKKSAAS